MFFRNFDVFDAAKSKVTQLLSDPDYIAGLSSNEIAELINSKRSFADLSVEAFNLYERLPGEAESRAVQSLFESGGALSSRAPTSYYDVPVSELINPWEVGKLDERLEIKTLLEFIRRLPEPSK